MTTDGPVWQKGRVNLRPLTVADILDGTFRLLKENWKPLGLLTLLLALPSALLTALLSAASTDFGAQPSFYALLLNGGDILATEEEPLSVAAIVAVLGGYAATILLAVTIQPFLLGAMVKVVAASYMGTELSASAALRSTLRHWLPLMAATILTGIAIFVGFFFCVVGVLVPLTFFFVFTAVITIESEGPIKALGRSFDLMKPRFWWYMLVVVLMYFLASIVSNLVSSPFLIAVLIAAAAELAVLEWIFSALNVLVATTLALPIFVVLEVLMYFDSRVRTEALDLQIAANQSEPTS